MARYSNSVPQIQDANGDPIVGAKKYFFEPGSSTLKTIYSDSALSLPTVNPVVSDSAGRFPDIFLDGTYKEVQEDENGVTLWTRDPVGIDTTGEWVLWDAGTTYSIPQIVLGSDDEYYRSLVDTNIGNDPTSSPASWEQIYLGRIWNANVTYSITDTVYGSDGYLYKSQINSNLNNDPTTDSVNWWPGSPEHLSITAAGTDTYTATYGEIAYKNGRRYYLNFTNANTSTTPTINLDAIGAKTIKKNGGLALLAGDIPAGHRAILEYDGTDMILLNPSDEIDLTDIMSVARLTEELPSGTDAGGSSTGWQTRVLNTEQYDPDGITSISSNEFILQNGTYMIHARCPGTKSQFRCALYNVTDTAYEAYGTNARCSSVSNYAQVESELWYRLVVSGGPKNYSIRMWVDAGIITDGLGNAISTPSVNEIYTTVDIWKMTS